MVKGAGLRASASSVIGRLHMLCEMEHAFTELQRQWQQDVGAKGSEPMLNWQARLEMIQNSFRVKEPILALCRAVLGLSKRYQHLSFLFFFLSLFFSMLFGSSRLVF